MGFIGYLPLTILIFFALKFLISYIDKSTISLTKKSIEKQIETGMLSIKDIKKNNYDAFVKVIRIYFEILEIKDITPIDNVTSELTNFKGFLDKEPVFISCIQNDLLGETANDEDKWEKTGRPNIQAFLSSVVLNNCKKGIIITNSTFSSFAIEFANEFNSKKLGIEIKLIDGYELTKSIRNHRYYIMKEGLINEAKYNI